MRRASCAGKPPPVPVPVAAPGFKSGQGQSLDNSLNWAWSVGGNGERRFTASIWNGATFDEVVADSVAAP